MFEQIPKLDPIWRAHLEQECAKPYMQNLKQFLHDELQQKATIYPPQSQWFNSFLFTPFNDIKVVIMGQDPYHGAGQAHGLSFSVPDGVKVPPSLKNIYKELNRDLNISVPVSGNLQAWAEQGVLLLNSCLTVREAEPGSHAKQGWETFTNSCIELVNQQAKHVVFLAWGKFAHGVCNKIDAHKHCLIKTSHPSPLGATKQGADFCAFLGSGCFSKTNAYLQAHHKAVIDWDLHPNLSLL